MMHYTIQPLAWFVVLAVLMSFIEHQIHRRLMHRKNMLSGRLPAFKKVFEHHAMLHHGQYHQIFHDEPVPHGQDRHLRLSMKEGVLEALPIAVLMTTISWQGAMTFVIVVCLHHCIWNQIHMEMHKPEKRFFSHWSTYKFLARHHYLHHRYPHKNFNVVFPLADYVLGTNIRASTSDLEDMDRLGLLP
jgi:Fatty acid hydroxylase superfamily